MENQAICLIPLNTLKSRPKLFDIYIVDQAIKRKFKVGNQ